MGRPITDALKFTWPEVVGWAYTLAEGRIQGDRPDVYIELHYVGDNVQPGYDPTRVRLFINHDFLGTVAQMPIVG
jgi:hypothetical protein